MKHYFKRSFENFHKEKFNCSKSQEYNAIDVMKFICSILVVCIHTSPLSDYNYVINFTIVNVFARLAVPFFFICSGYFLFKKFNISHHEEEVKNKNAFTAYIKRLLILYFLWSGIYFINTIYSWINAGTITIKNILQVIRGILLMGIAVHLWYIPGLILAITLVYFGFKHLPTKNIIIIAVIFYIIGLMGDSYFGLIKDMPVIGLLFKVYNFICGSTRNGLFFGFLFVALGAYFTRKKLLIRRGKLFLLLFISITLMIVEIFALQTFDIPKDLNMCVFLVPSIVCLFLLLLNIQVKPCRIYKILRSLSSLIYFSHIIFVIIYQRLFDIINFNSGVNFMLVLISSFIFSLTVFFLSQQKRFTFLKTLY